MSRSLVTYLGYGTLAAITLGHIAYRVAWSNDRDLLEVSEMEIGSPFPEIEFIPLDESRPLASAPLPSGCFIAVVFNPFCPHCHNAATAAKENHVSSSLETVWVSVIGTQPAVDFGYAVHASSQVRYGVGSSEAFEINAVPAAFLVGKDRNIKYIWTYSGKENHSDLRERCV